MPLSLHIDADNATDLVAQLSALAVALAGTAAVATPSADPKPATRTKKSEPAAQNSDAGATSSAQQSSAAAETVTKDTVAALCNSYGSKAGATALQEIFKELGSPQGKFSGVPEASYPALHARLTELLAAA